MRTRLPLAVAVTALVVAGCGGHSSAPSSAPLESSSEAPAGAAAASSAPATTSSKAPASGAAVARPGSAGASAGAGQSTPQAAAAAPAAAADDTATAPGRYTYDSSGTVNAGKDQHVEGTATLTVDPPSGDRQHSVLESGEQGSTEQTVVVRTTGTYLARLKLTNPGFTKEFAPPEPVLLMPDPASPGRSWSWTAKSTDGKTTVAVAARVVRNETVVIGGVDTPTTVVESTLRLSGDVTYTAQMQTWYDPAHRLRVKEHTKGNGMYGGIAFTTDTTSVLRSTKPS